MKFLNENLGQGDADSADDAEVSTERLQQQVAEAYQQLKTVPAENKIERAEILVQIGGTLVDLKENEEAFDVAKQAFDVFTQLEHWDGAVQACDVMYQADQSLSLPALGQGVWLSVTFPVDPELTVALLNHIVEETPDDSDGGALAACVASYVVDMRAKDKQHENLSFFCNNLLGTVARRHSDVDSQEQFDYWIEKLELNDPAKFLPRFRNVVDVLVQDDWWVDRDAIWASLPDQ